jgi:hypothetical protein
MTPRDASARTDFLRLVGCIAAVCLVVEISACRRSGSGGHLTQTEPSTSPTVSQAELSTPSTSFPSTGDCAAANPPGVRASDAGDQALRAVGPENKDSLVIGNGALWTLRSALDVPPTRERDGTFSLKFPWFRAVAGWVDIAGHRVDGPGTFRADSPHSGYPPTGFVPSMLYFSGSGCWEVTGREAASAVTVRIHVADG